VVAVCGDRLDDHPLAREIVATVVTNRLVDDNGITFVHRLREETGAPLAAIVRAWAVARHCTDQDQFLDEISMLPRIADVATRIVMQLKHRRLVERAVRWLLATRRHQFEVDVVATEFSSQVRALRAELPTFLVGADRHAAESRVRRYTEQRHLPREVARRCASLFEEFSLFSICDIARRREADQRGVARLYCAVAARLRLDAALRRIAALQRSDNWDAMSRAVLRDHLYAAVREITDTLVCAGTDPSDVERTLNDAAGADWLDNLLTAALDPVREPDLPVLLVAAEAAKSFAATIDITAAAAC
jgi:glutamate dehydrogenase